MRPPRAPKLTRYGKRCARSPAASERSPCCATTSASTCEIADHLGIAEGTVKAMLFRARQSLAALLHEPPDPTDEPEEVRGARG